MESLGDGDGVRGTGRQGDLFGGPRQHFGLGDCRLQDPPHACYRFDRHDNGGGTGSLEVDGEVVAEGPIPRFTVAAFSATGAGLSCGYELGPAVGDDYEAPFACTAVIHRATVTLSEHVPVNPMVEFERIMSEQ